MIGPPEEMTATVQRVFVRFAEFLFFLQRGAAALVRKNSHGRGVLGGYSGGAREYYWGTTGVLQGYYYSRCSPEEPSSIPLTANWKKVQRATVGSVTVLQYGCSVSRY